MVVIIHHKNGELRVRVPTWNVELFRADPHAYLESILATLEAPFWWEIV